MLYPDPLLPTPQHTPGPGTLWSRQCTYLKSKSTGSGPTAALRQLLPLRIFAAAVLKPARPPLQPAPPPLGLCYWFGWCLQAAWEPGSRLGHEPVTSAEWRVGRIITRPAARERWAQEPSGGDLRLLPRLLLLLPG